MRSLARALLLLLVTAAAAVAQAPPPPPGPPGAPPGPQPTAPLFAAPPAAPQRPADPEVVGGLIVRSPGVVTVMNRWFHLLGVEGLDEDAQCTRDGAPFACGIVGMAKLAEIANGKVLHCRLQQFAGDTRWWGTCAPYDPGIRGPSPTAATVNQEWVRSGWAKAHTLHSAAYKADEDAARAAKLGMWAGAPPAALADATTVEGAARVLDGNTLMVGATKVHLDAIDAPELSHVCRIGGRTYDCGEVAKGYLLDSVMGRRITCALSKHPGDDRTFGVCRVVGSDPAAANLNERMVRSGWALADRRIADRYAADEGLAQRERRGMWAGQFIQPFRWRQGDR
jgi:endonuclease YncB( thermonuclease family)